MSIGSPPPLAPRASVAAQPAAGTLDRKWATLLQAAEVVAALAGRLGETAPSGERDLPLAAQAAGDWRLSLTAHGIDDLAAVLEPGLGALLAIHGRGADPTGAAEALWEEFEAARDALLALAAPAPDPARVRL